METLAHAAIQVSYSPSRLTMPKYSEPQLDSPLGILSAEQYNDSGRATREQKQRYLPQIHQQQQGQQPGGMVFGLVAGFDSQNMTAPQEQPQPPLSRKSSTELADGERRKKRQKIINDDDAEDESKKSRGRPRLDTQDQTAAERRRTQIRMAQRAYRHRKESTISSLEKQVEELRGTNEEMNKIFIKLYDFAVSKGLPQREPEFGQHLQASTEMFLALAKSTANDDGVKEEDSNEVGGATKRISEPSLESVISSRQVQVAAPLHQPEASVPLETSVWGYSFSKEGDYVPQHSQTQFDPREIVLSNRSPEHQVISRATLDNASFPFDIPHDLQQYHAQVPESYDSFQLATKIPDSLPLASTYHQQETSFGRRLQRAAVERGWKLISARNPNPVRYREVYGFCLRFETHEDIYRRMESLVNKSSKEALYDWRQPFVHLGGSGTFYPSDQDISGELMPKLQTGRSMGPFSHSVMETRDEAMLDDFHINLDGFKGVFFDSNDVDGYLRGHGIDVSLNSEYVTVNLDLLPPFDLPSPSTVSENSSKDFVSPKTPQSPVVRVAELVNNDEVIMPDYGSYSVDLSDQDRNMKAAIASNCALSLPFPIGFTEWDNSESISTSIPNSIDIPGPILQLSMDPAAGARPRERFVTISATVLIEELISKAICLGRAPGFRPSDVDAAIRRTLKSVF